MRRGGNTGPRTWLRGSVFGRALGIQEHDALLFRLEGDRLIVTSLPRRPLGALYGALPASRPYPGMEAIRQEVRAKLAERSVRGDA
jgi:hypothetical protein